jgi:DnaK suppressor protein
MPASKSSKKKSAARKTAAAGKGVSRKKPAARSKASARAPAAKKAAARKPAATKKSQAAKKPVAKKAPARKAPARKAPAKKVTAKKAAAAKPAAKKAAKKAASNKTAAARNSVAAKTTAKIPPLMKKPALKKKVLALKPELPEPTFGFSGPLKSFKPYQPKPREDYMSDGMREHFRQILLTWKQELMEEVDRTVHHMKDEAANFPDPNDRATQESEFGLELRTRDRERKLLKKIEQALARIDDGTYGYCSETGEEIGLRRLEARPVATLTVEAQERRELAEKQYRDRDDR